MGFFGAIFLGFGWADVMLVIWKNEGFFKGFFRLCKRDFCIVLETFVWDFRILVVGVF